MAARGVGDAYDAQAEFLTGALGTTVHPRDPDRAVIESWANSVTGSILDVGSGTGRWTGHLAALGHDVAGIDPSEKFVETARRAHPGIPFRVAAVRDLGDCDERWSGILAWYSLIHLDLDDLRAALRHLRHALDGGGSILMSFFTAPRTERFNHPVAPAYRWPIPVMSELLWDAGFRVLDRHYAGSSSHAAITASLQGGGPAPRRGSGIRSA